MNRVFALRRIRAAKRTAPGRTYWVTLRFETRTALLPVRAASREEVKQKVRELIGSQGRVVKIRRAWWRRLRRPGPDEMSELCESLQAYIEAGIPPGEMLREHALMIENKLASSAFLVALHHVQQGHTLAEAFAMTELFGPDMLEFIRLGEETGNIEEIFREMADDYAVMGEVQATAKQALFYPFIIVIASIISLGIFRFMVYDVLVRMYQEFDMQVPLTLDIIRTVVDYAPLVLLAGVVLWPFLQHGLRAWYRARRHRLHQSLLRIPLVGRIFLDYALVRAFSSLRSSARSNMGPRMCFKLLSTMIWLEPIRRAFEEVYRSVDDPDHPLRGQNVSDILLRNPEFPRTAASMIRTAEETGQYERIYTIMRDNRRKALKREVRILSFWVEIGMILMVGLAVLFIMISFYLPYFQALGRIG